MYAYTDHVGISFVDPRPHPVGLERFNYQNIHTRSRLLHRESEGIIEGLLCRDCFFRRIWTCGAHLYCRSYLTMLSSSVNRAN